MHYHEYVRFTEMGIFFSFIAFLIKPILSPYMKGLGFDELQLCMIFSVFTLTIILFSPIIGKISDNVGRKTMILFGVVINILAMIFYIMDGSWVFLVIARIFNAIGYVTVAMIILSKIGDSVDGKTRGKYTGWTLSLENIAKSASPIVGGVLADMFFIKAPFYMSIFLLLILMVYLIKQKPRRKAKIKKSDFNIIGELKEFLSERKLKGLALLGMTTHASIPAIYLFLPLLIVEKFGLSFTYVGVAYFFLGFFNLFQFYFGEISDKMGRSKMLILGTSIYGFGLILLSVSQSYPMLLLVLVLQGLGGSMWNISAYCIMAESGEKSKKEAQTLMSYESLARTGSFFSFIISGFVVTIFNVESLFVLNGILILAVSLCAVRYIVD